MNCDDWPNHQGLIPLGGFLPSPCSASTGRCAKGHSRYRRNGFQVCDLCQVHSLQLMQLEQPTATSQIPFNLARLSQGFAYVPPNPGPPAMPAIVRPQSGVGPPEFTPWGGGQVGPQLLPLIPPVVPPQPYPPPAAPMVQWQVDNELATGLLTSTRRSPVFEGFLTRVCAECEISIQSEVRYRDLGPIVGTAKEVTEWEDYPWISCTCKYALGFPANVAGTPRYCLSHLREAWNQLVAKRDANDRWLRQIWRDPRDGHVERKGPRSVVLKRRVMIPGTYRACRCGKEVDTLFANQPEVYICMGCEGWISRVGRNTSYNLLSPAQVSRERRQFKAKYKLRRNEL